MNDAAPIPAADTAFELTQAPPPIAAGARTGRPRAGDLTQGPIVETLLLFSIPTLIANVLQTLNGSINAIWVGRLLGESALAATANANVMMFLLFAGVFGFGMATTVRVGQHFGGGDLDRARATFGTGVGFCTLLALVTGIGGWFLALDLLRLLSTPAASVAQALAYLRVVFVTMPFATVSMMVSMGLRGAGDAKTPLYAMVLTVVLDIAFNPLLIRGIGPVPALGIAGSACSSALASLVGAVWMIHRIYARDLPLRLRGRELGYLVPRRAELNYMLAKGLPMGAQMLIVSSAGLVMIGLVNREGLNATAAFSASLQLWNYLQMPAMAIGAAVSAMVAQNLGAGDRSRANAVPLVGIGANLALSTSVAALIVMCDRTLLALFLGHDSPAMPIAEHIQLICTASFVIMSISMILIGAMRAYGVVLMPLLIMFVGLYPGRLGFYVLARPWLGGEAVWWAYPVGAAVSVALTVAFYASGGWRRGDASPSMAHAPVAGGS